MSGTRQLSVDIVTAENVHRLSAFADRQPLLYNDFASIASIMPSEPRVWVATDERAVAAAAIDDGLAMSVGGDADGLELLAQRIPDLDAKLVISGPVGETEAFVAAAKKPRVTRPELFMAVTREALPQGFAPVPLRIAEADDLQLLTDVRARALEEEYSISVPRTGTVYGELERAVARAVAMQGVAIWTIDGQVAFTAQLVAKTEHAAMFGDLYTDPQLRGEGRATAGLVNFCLWLMSESTNVTLRVGAENQPARRLYDRVGFQQVGTFVSSLAAGYMGDAGDAPAEEQGVR